MTDVYAMIERAAEADVAVLLVGETGTGKELVAREIHARSQRQKGPFVAVNTGALSAELVASELFGHVKGAFTGADDSHEGRFSEADSGTLFLDEVATMPERIQVVFLRVLEAGVFRSVGANQDRQANVRVIAATNMDLRQAVDAGQFREDLLQRLTVFRIVLPPLRERLEDLPALAQHVLDVHAQDLGLDVEGVSDEALEVFARYPWPGNVRELKNAIIQAAIMAREGVILPEHIPLRITSYLDPDRSAAPVERSDSGTQPPGLGVAGGETAQDSAVPQAAPPLVLPPAGLRLEDLDRAYVLKTLAACDNNKTRAAAMLGISRKTLREWLTRWEMKP